MLWTMLAVTLFVGLPADGDTKAVKASDNGAQELNGRWRIVDIKPARVTSWTLKEAQKQIGRVATIDSEAIVFGEARCERSSYVSRSVSADDYFIETINIPKSYVGVRQRNVTVLASETCDHPIDQVIIFSAKKLGLVSHGFVLFLAKQ